jgi:hypothetical protein
MASTPGVTSSYTPTPAEVSGTSIWKNGRYGVYIDQGASADSLGPDGNIAGKLGNVIYDNGTFGFTALETWQQLKAIRDAPTAIDWSNNYWGPVVFIPCGLGPQIGHLSFALTDGNTTTPYPVDRGPVSYTTTADISDPTNPLWCGNDSVLDYPGRKRDAGRLLPTTRAAGHGWAPARADVGRDRVSLQRPAKRDLARYL